jgi:VWFA-related protein
MRTAVPIVALAVLALGQQPDADVKFTVTTNLVVVNVDVRDKDGKAVEGLKAPDFTILEDGKPQTISVFEYQRLETEAAPPASPSLKPRPAEGQEGSKREITPSAQGKVLYKDRRLIVLFFDQSSMPQADQLRAYKAALEFIDKQLTPSDLVAVMAFSTTLQVMEDFTADRDRLRAAIKALQIGEGSELSVAGAAGESEDAEDTGEAFTADESEFNIFNTDRKLGALESAAKMLASLPEKKALVYFSSGVGKTGVENQSQLRSTVNAAVRSNVSFYPVDARGLVASAPAGDATARSPRGSGVYSGAAQRGMRQKFNDQQETLYSLAEDTGGKALLDSNDLTSGIRQAQKDIASYYILGYYSTNAAQDGRFRRIRVNVQSVRQARLDYRSGYFAAKEFGKFDSTDKERQLEEAMLLGDPITDLPVALEVNYFRIAPSQYFVPVAAKIPGSAVELARSGSSDEAELDFIGQVRDAKGRLAGAVRDMIKVRLKGADAATLGRRNLGYDSGFLLAPGEYSLKFVARENTTGKIGTFETRFAIPDLASESRWLRTSSVVWANQREPLKAAVGAAERNRKLMALHPLIQDGQKLLPSITRVYRKDQALYVYVEVYDAALAGGANSPSVTATLTLFRGRRKAFETEMLRVRETARRRAFVTPVQFRIPLSELAAGRYTCQVSLIDELGQKFAFSRAPMVLLP